MLQFSHAIVEAQEAERKKISRELHDVIIQTLAGIGLQVAALNLDDPTNHAALARKIARTQKLVAKSVSIVHQFARDLRPTVLDDLGLVAALRDFTKDFAKRTHIVVELAAPLEDGALTPDQRTVLYRVAQMALTNVARHAKASAVRLTLQKLGADIVMEISDNGIGFDMERTIQAKRHKRLGVIGMAERLEMVGGSFAMQSSPGHGTTVQTRIPLNSRCKI